MLTSAQFFFLLAVSSLLPSMTQSGLEVELPDQMVKHAVDVMAGSSQKDRAELANFECVHPDNVDNFQLTTPWLRQNKA